MQPPQISVSDRATRQEQIEEIFDRARAKGEPLRIRIPFGLYDYGPSRSYVNLRDASWNLQLTLEDSTPQTINAMIETVGACITAISELGLEEVKKRLATPTTAA